MKSILVKWYSATIQKYGNLAVENEDKYAPLLANGAIYHGKDFRCALSDGATESSFSQSWANYLVTEFINSKTEGPTTQFISSAIRKLKDEVNTIVLPWHAQEKLRNGSHATFLGLDLLAGDPDVIYPLCGNWKALCVGDSYLFHYRREVLVTSVPKDNGESFNNRPKLIGSKQANQEIGHSQFNGTWKSGDDFLLMTDAIAEWAFRNMENNVNIPGVIKDKLTRKSKINFFSDWINHLRVTHEIKNDDTTVIWIKVY
jgi:hypothetical protein